MATETFQNVLHFIQTSGLNFKMEISPFSAAIHIKNSTLKDKKGNPLIYPSESSDNSSQIKSENVEQAKQILHQENAIQILKGNFENTLNECAIIYETKTHFENVIQTLHSKPENSELKTAEISNAEIKNETKISLEKEVQKQRREILDLAMTSDNSKNVAKRLQRELNESNKKAKTELDNVKKDFEAEIKAWRKELGEERRNKIKLEN